MSGRKTGKNISRKKEHFEPVSLMEPCLPTDGIKELEDLAIELIAKSQGLSSLINPITRKSIGDLVRSMNCYYSNLIEGHNTHPRDIDKALKKDFSKDIKKRNLQLEARAHIEVQELIDKSNPDDLVSIEFIKWIHEEFCKRLPEELLWVENPETKKKIRFEPGELRNGDVQIGMHLPPHYKILESFLKRFEDAYNPNKLSKLKQIIAIAASHHRLLWIHPFFDGNGRVTRLFSHAYLKQVGIGNSLWSISRGLARRVSEYKALLMAADEKRKNDLDGRGNLSHEALVDFSKFFLESCIDQIDYMSSILEPKELLRRIELYARDEIDAKRLPKNADLVLREVLLAGEIERKRVAEITGYQERQARNIISNLLSKDLLVSNSPKGKLSLGVPIDVVERWLPKLYPL